MPEGSLGHVYLRFLESENISAEGIVAARDEGRTGDAPTEESAWLHRRMRDTHDLWHAVTGHRRDVHGEAALLGFILSQTGNPGVGMIFALGLMKTGREAAVRRLMPDGFRRGRRADTVGGGSPRRPAQPAEHAYRPAPTRLTRPTANR